MVRGSGPWPQGPRVAVVGARPNFVKLAPLLRASQARGEPLRWIHTGQHTDERLARRLWQELGVAPPAVTVAPVAPGRGRAERMARALLDPLAGLGPRLVVVVGDVDSTVAGALAARRLGVPLAHVEAGLRSHDRSMPEERNRVRVDRIAGLLHASEPEAVRQLAAEGLRGRRVHLAGNVLADQVAWARPRLRQPLDPALRVLARDAYGVVTLHRPVNVDSAPRLARWARALAEVGRELPLVFPLHPRTRARLGPGLARWLRGNAVRVVRPLGQLEFLGLVARARLVLTDSGGLPVECSLLGVPCLTLRPRYEHALTLTRGTNHLGGGDPRRLAAQVRGLLGAPRRVLRRALPSVWDGHAAERIVARWTRGASGSITK